MTMIDHMTSYDPWGNEGAPKHRVAACSPALGKEVFPFHLHVVCSAWHHEVEVEAAGQVAPVTESVSVASGDRHRYHSGMVRFAPIPTTAKSMGLAAARPDFREVALFGYMSLKGAVTWGYPM